MEQREPSYTVGGIVSWYSHCGKQYGRSRKLKTELPYNPAVSLGIDPAKTLIQKDTCTPMLIAALFTIAKTWKRPKMLINKRMDKEDAAHIYNGIALSHKQGQNNTILQQRGCNERLSY